MVDRASDSSGVAFVRRGRPALADGAAFLADLHQQQPIPESGVDFLSGVHWVHVGEGFAGNPRSRHTGAIGATRVTVLLLQTGEETRHVR